MNISKNRLTSPPHHHIFHQSQTSSPHHRVVDCHIPCQSTGRLCHRSLVVALASLTSRHTCLCPRRCRYIYPTDTLIVASNSMSKYRPAFHLIALRHSMPKYRSSVPYVNGRIAVALSTSRHTRPRPRRCRVVDVAVCARLSHCYTTFHVKVQASVP